MGNINFLKNHVMSLIEYEPDFLIILKVKILKY